MPSSRGHNLAWGPRGGESAGEKVLASAFEAADELGDVTEWAASRKYRLHPREKTR